MHNLRAAAVHNGYNVALQVLHIPVACAIVHHHCRAPVRTVEEVQIVAALGQLYYIFPVKYIVRDRSADIFLHPQAVFIVGVAHAASALAHALQLPALCPDVRPRAVARRVANRIIGDGRAVVRSQLVLPVSIAIGVRDRLHRRAHGSCRIGIRLLTGHVAAQVIAVHPSRACAACRGIIWVVRPDQLPQQVIPVAHRLAPVVHTGHVPCVVVGVGQRLEEGGAGEAEAKAGRWMRKRWSPTKRLHPALNKIQQESTGIFIFGALCHQEQ